MRRLILAPVVCAPIAAAATLLWVKGLAHPILTTAWSILAPRPVTDTDEADVWA